MRHRLLFFAKLLLSAGLFVYLAKQTNTEAFWAMLENVDGFFVFLSLALSAVMIAVSCVKWWIVMGESRQKVTFFEMFKVYLIGYYFNNLLPSNIGGDVVRSYLLGQRIGSHGASAVGVFVERSSGLGCLLLLVILSPLTKPDLYRHPAIWLPALLAAGLLLFITLLVTFRRSLQQVEVVVPFVIDRFVPAASLRNRLGVLSDSFFARLRSLSSHLNSSLALLRDNPSDLFGVLATTAAFYAMTFLNAYLAFRAFGVGPAWADLVAVTPAATLVGMIPIAPFGSLGLMEASLTGYFALVGISPASGMAMALFLRFKQLLIGLVGFFFFLGQKQNNPVSRGTDAEC